uniref:Uncharacterized protein n=1 Tax=Ligilactobacillus acidipiscis TaxID=89059 RepID=A0A2R8FGA2_9LACO|nr:hypothetical protein PLAC02_P66 [Ligilactobacillus acidipiscis]
MQHFFDLAPTTVTAKLIASKGQFLPGGGESQQLNSIK